MKDPQATYSSNVAQNAMNLQVHLVQSLLHVQDMLSCHLNQAGAIPPTATRRGSCPCLSRSYCAASCSTCCHRGSCASATSDSSPTGDAPHCCRCASTARRIRENGSSGSITVCPIDSLCLELPHLQRNHARCRTALRRATPAPLSASSRQVRSMNHCSHPQPPTVLRHAHRPLVSSDSGCRDGCHCTPGTMPPCDPSTLKLSLKPRIVPVPAPCLTLSTCATPFKVHSLPWGQLPSSRCIRSAPPEQHATAHCCASVRSRYGTKTWRLNGTNLGTRQHS